VRRVAREQGASQVETYRTHRSRCLAPVLDVKPWRAGRRGFANAGTHDKTVDNVDSMSGVLAVDVALVPLAFLGIALIALGALHLWKTDRFFAFYARFNEGKRYFQLFGGASERATRLVGVGLIGVGGMALIGAFT